MTRHDENLSAAMHAIAPETDDVPDLFERVAAGAKRRRHRRSAAAVGGVAVVVALIALVPALSGPGSPHKAPALAGSGTDIDPGFTGKIPATSAPPTSSPNAVAPETTGPAVLPASTPSPLPTNAKGCPTIAALPPGADAVAHAEAAAIAAIPQRYGDALAKNYVVKAVYPASTGKGYGIVADAICGKALGDVSYVVELGFGGDSASVGAGQLFVANFGGGWQVWFQYH